MPFSITSVKGEAFSVPALVTLLTDFGTRDAYVAAMKGVILSIAPDVTIIDISHEVAPQDVMEAAFVLGGAVQHFPDSTIHVAVVDPGVGSERRPVALRFRDHIFVGPDNGLFTLLMKDEQPSLLVELDRPEFWRTTDVSATFHGRDVFAPVAAHLAAGRELDDMGRRIEQLAPMHWALPTVDEHGFQGWVVHVDHFGNCISNISRDAFLKVREGRVMKGFAGSAILTDVYHTYSDVAAGEPLLLFNSENLLEIAVYGGSAAKLLSIQKGAPVNVVFTAR